MNGSLNACMMYPYKTVGTCILFSSLCLLRSSTLRSLDVLKVFQGDVRWITREVAIQIPADQSWLEKTLYRLIVDVPAEHLNLLKTNPSLDLNSLSLVVNGIFVV